MEKFRENIIKEIINSPDETSVSSIIDKPVKKLIENGTHIIFILRMVDKLKSTLIEIKREPLTLQERNNISQALNMLNDYDVKKITEAKTTKQQE